MNKAFSRVSWQLQRIAKQARRESIYSLPLAGGLNERPLSRLSGAALNDRLLGRVADGQRMPKSIRQLMAVQAIAKAELSYSAVNCPDSRLKFRSISS